MQETIKLEISQTEAKHLETILDSVLKEIDASLERMDKYEAARLKTHAETEAIRAQIKVMLNVE